MAAGMPGHAPYEDVEVGEEVEIRVFEDPPGRLVAECEFRGDRFGAALDMEGLDQLSLAVEVDALVTGIGALVYNELLGEPVFRDQDQAWVERVDARRPWSGFGRKPERGWIGSVENPEALDGETTPGPEGIAGMVAVTGPPVDRDAPVGTALEDARPGDPVQVALGDADIIDLKLTGEEAAALARGEMPETVAERLLRARSTESLLDSVDQYLFELPSAGGVDDPGLTRVRAEIGEVLRRFRTP